MNPRSSILALALLSGCAATRPGAQIPRPIPLFQENPTEFFLGQPWTARPDPRLRPTKVTLSWNPEALAVTADLLDDDIQSGSTGDNQPMWELGDVFEVFLAKEGNPGYLELHVTPRNHRTHVRLPGPGGRPVPDGEPLPFEKMTVAPVGFASKATRTPGGWRVQARLPASLLDLRFFRSGQRFRVSFCRYDAHFEGQPTLSTSSPHPVISFHRPEEWQHIVLRN